MRVDLEAVRVKLVRLRGAPIIIGACLLFCSVRWQIDIFVSAESRFLCATPLLIMLWLLRAYFAPIDALANWSLSPFMWTLFALARAHTTWLNVVALYEDPTKDLLARCLFLLISSLALAAAGLPGRRLVPSFWSRMRMAGIMIGLNRLLYVYTLYMMGTDASNVPTAQKDTVCPGSDNISNETAMLNAMFGWLLPAAVLNQNVRLWLCGKDRIVAPLCAIGSALPPVAMGRPLGSTRRRLGPQTSYVSAASALIDALVRTLPEERPPGAQSECLSWDSQPAADLVGGIVPRERDRARGARSETLSWEEHLRGQLPFGVLDNIARHTPLERPRDARSEALSWTTGVSIQDTASGSDVSFIRQRHFHDD